MNNTSFYDPDWVSAYYDKYGEQEWERFSRTPADEVSLLIHAHYLRNFVKPSSRVLDAGAGPGRFTRILAEMDCHVVVADISEVQLSLHRKYARNLCFEDAVENRLQLDICAMPCLESDSFDAVVCYGGPLSYVFEKAPDALQECRRVCRSGGHILVSVMSLWGAVHRYLDGVLALPPGINRKITDTGDLTPGNWDGATHHCHMFTSAELRQALDQAGLAVVAMSASNCLVTRWDDEIRAARQDAEQWQELLRMETEACAAEGCVDMGSHIIAVGRK